MYPIKAVKFTAKYKILFYYKALSSCPSSITPLSYLFFKKTVQGHCDNKTLDGDYLVVEFVSLHA